MKKYWLLPLAVGICTLLAFRELSLQNSNVLKVHFFDIGQGDAAMLVTPSGQQIVIDGGPDTSLLEHLGSSMPFLDRTIELLVLSHPDADHLTALPDILERYKIEKVLLSGVPHTSGRYEKFLALLKEQATTVIVADPSEDIAMGDGVVLDTIWPPSESFGTEFMDSNDSSVVLRVLYGKNSILFTGDIEEIAEQAILQTGADIRSSILKVAHHGSRTSSSTGFLLAVQPDLAVISVGRDNPFGHPHLDIVDRYRHFGIPVVSTAESGTISLKLQP